MKIIFKESKKEFTIKDNFKRWYDEKYCLAAIKQNGYALRYVKDQTEAVCLAAIKQNGDALQYVKDQTEAVCLAAIKQNGDAMQYVKEDSLFIEIVE